ncbi:MAG TPA: STAS domain-containing protein [Aggregatilinea sp.]|uniref:STAS domain-containing protein n=1 Tax=Aggregatilinea sp. TaxID=2806333 RepID=UPI002B8B80F6|nr:STAS domain-containing protein [Aggregatilinea sp.]HML22721.1 STAS domain-containing protein [Aggregatilinea sp.]
MVDSTRNGNRPQYFEIIGRINDENAARLVESLETAISAGHHNLVLDLSGVDYMNSAGLRALVTLYKQVERVAGTLTIANPSDRVKTLFALVGLDSVLDIEEDSLSSNGTRLSDSERALPYREVYYFS